MTGCGATMPMNATAPLRRAPVPLLLLAALLACGTPAPGQDRGREVIFRVLCFEHVGGLTSAYAQAAGKEGGKVEVPLFTSEFSGEFKGLFAGGKASLFTEEPGPDGKPARKVVAQGPLANAPRQAFILVPATAPAAGLVYQIVAWDDRESAFPMGGTRVVNFAPFPVRLHLAGADLPPIPPGGSRVYPQVKTVDEWNMYSVRIDFATAADTWVPVATQSWKASPRKRDWVITRFNPANRQPVIRLYQDVPPWRLPKLPAPAPR